MPSSTQTEQVSQHRMRIGSQKFSFFLFYRVNGCYEALNGGNLSDALVDFTSGISETIEVDARHFASDERARNDLFKKLLKEKENHALMCCAVAVSFSTDRTAPMPQKGEHGSTS